MQNTLASRINIARRHGRLTQRKLADAVGVRHKAYVSMWEHSHRAPKPETLDRIAEVTGVDRDWLHTGKGQPAPWPTRWTDGPPPPDMDL